MADLDRVDYDSLPGAPQQADAPLRVTVYPRRAELRFVPVDHDPFADDGAADRTLKRLGVDVANGTATSWVSNPAAGNVPRFPDKRLADAASRSAAPRLVPVDHDPFADDGVAGAAKPFTPIPSSSQKRAASILSCETAYIRCMQARAGSPVWCNAARDACLKTGVLTIFPGGFVGQGG